MPINVATLATVWRYFQPGLLEAVYPCHPLRRTEFPPIHSHQQSPCCLLPSLLPNEDSHDSGFLCCTASQEIERHQMALTILPRHWRRNRSDPDDCQQYRGGGPI